MQHLFHTSFGPVTLKHITVSLKKWHYLFRAESNALHFLLHVLGQLTVYC